MITAEDYTFLAKLLCNISGLELGPDKGYLLQARLEPLAGKLGLKDIPELVTRLRKNSDSQMVEAVVDAMTTQESLFFRDAVVYDNFRGIILPQLLERKKNNKLIRIWSAACSTGQEPYSIAMTFELYPKDLRDWAIEIIATDLSKLALTRAKAGVYSQMEVQRGLSEAQLNRFFSRQEKGNTWKINPDITRRVTFRQFNLLHPTVNDGPYDVVFCRNVLIYMNVETRKRVLNTIADILTPNGFLILGSSENIIGITEAFSRVEEFWTGIYKKT